MLFTGGSWMVTVISHCVLGGYHIFLMGHGWSPVILNNSNTCTVRTPCPVLPLCHWLTAIQRHSHQKMLPRNPPTTKCFFWEPSGKPHKVMSSTRAAELKKIALVVQMDGQRHPRRPQCHTLFAACNPFRNGCHQTHTQVPLPLREARANIRRLTSHNQVICTPPLGFQRVDVDLTTYHCRLCKEYPSALQIPVPIQYCGSTLGWGQPWVNPAP